MNKSRENRREILGLEEFVRKVSNSGSHTNWVPILKGLRIGTQILEFLPYLRPDVPCELLSHTPTTPVPAFPVHIRPSVKSETLLQARIRP